MKKNNGPMPENSNLYGEDRRDEGVKKSDTSEYHNRVDGTCTFKDETLQSSARNTSQIDYSKEGTSIEQKLANFKGFLGGVSGDFQYHSSQKHVLKDADKEIVGSVAADKVDQIINKSQVKATSFQAEMRGLVISIIINSYGIIKNISKDVMARLNGKDPANDLRRKPE